MHGRYGQGAEIGTGIMFSDSDSLSQNSQIVYEILNDYRELLHPKCQAFEVNQMGLHTSAINCSKSFHAMNGWGGTVNPDHDIHNHRHSSHCAELYFSRTGHLSHSPYCVIIRASDPTVEPGLSRRRPAEATVCLVADTSKVHDADRPTIVAQALHSNAGIEASATRKRNRKNRKLVAGSDESSAASSSSAESAAAAAADPPKKLQPIYYPHEVTVSRRSTALFRVVEPLSMHELLRNGGPVFRISEDRTGAFAITSAAGIVYVKNTTALRNASADRH